jgi:acyl carrier protein
MSHAAVTHDVPAHADVENMIIAVLARLKGSTPTEVGRALRRRGESMPCDSLESVEVVLELEDRYNITLPDNQQTADALRSVSSLATLVRSRLVEDQASA